MSGRTDPERHEAGRYEIRLKGRLDPRWAARFDGLTLTDLTDGTTVIDCAVADQAALHGLLRKVRDTGLELLSVICTEPDQPAVSAPRPQPAPTTSRTGDPT